MVPPFYPNADTLANAEAAEEQMAHIRTLLDAGIPGEWAVKDSFRSLDLVPLGFRPLFDASWITRPSTAARPEADISGVHWDQVRSAAGLAAWEAAWRGEQRETDETHPIFLPGLLDDKDIIFIEARHAGTIIAGAIANRTGEVVGLSNLFVRAEDDESWRAGCVGAVMDLFPELPIVGYEAGHDLRAMLAQGFEKLGPVRIWVRTTETK